MDDKDKEHHKVVSIKPKKPEEGGKVLPFDPDIMPPRKVLQEALDHADQIEAVMVVIIRKDGGVGLETSDMDSTMLSMMVHRADFEMMNEINASLVIEDDTDPA